LALAVELPIITAATLAPRRRITVDFSLTEEQELVRQTAREFAEE